LQRSGYEYVGAMIKAFEIMHKSLEIDPTEIPTIVKTVSVFETELNTILTNMKGIFPLGYPTLISEDPRLNIPPLGKKNHPNFDIKVSCWQWNSLS